MQPRDRFISALNRQPLEGLVPHFELVFFLTMEAFGRVHPSHRNYVQWDQMQEDERELHRKDMAEIYVQTAERYEHSAIFVHPNPGRFEETRKQIEAVRNLCGDKYFIMIHGDATYEIPAGDGMLEFSYRLADEPDEMKAEAAAKVDLKLEQAATLKQDGVLDGFALCSDYCFNNGPFMSPDQFGEFITPYLSRLIAGYRELGLYSIKHTDGNIMPILDQLMEAKPDALHSLDPQGGVDMKEIKQLIGDRVCLIGNVNCGLVDTGTLEEALESASYALEHGMPGGGYIFSTSNCIYTGMRLERYEAIWNLWKEKGIYAS